MKDVMTSFCKKVSLFQPDEDEIVSDLEAAGVWVAGHLGDDLGIAGGFFIGCAAQGIAQIVCNELRPGILIELRDGTGATAVEERRGQPIILIAFVGKGLTHQNDLHVGAIAVERFRPSIERGEIILRLAVGIVDILVIAVALPAIVER